MANITGLGNLNGTASADIIVATGPNTGLTINGLGGNDVIFGDHDQLWQDANNVNNSIATALNIDSDLFWSTQPNPDIGDDSVPYTSILGTGAGGFDYFEVTVGDGETITVDIDYAGSVFGGPSFDSRVSLLDASHFGLASDIIGIAPFADDGFGTYSATDSFFSYTNISGSAQTYYLRVEQEANLPVSTGDTYMLNVSVTGHANTNLYHTGDETILGGDGDDIIYGMGGDDLLFGESGDDFIIGGSGVDTIFGGAGSDTLFVGLEGISTAEIYDGGNTGTDRDILVLRTSSVAYTVNLETAAFNTVSGGAAATVNDIEIVLAGNGDDVLVGGVVSFIGYTLHGGEGNDRIGPGSLYIQSGDIFDGGIGTDTLDFTNQTGAQPDYRVNLTTAEFKHTVLGPFIGNLATAANFENIDAGSGNDNLTGTSGVNIITGGKGDDFIDGSAGNDTLTGNKGRDTLIGGTGDDDLFGNRGIDFFDPGAGQDDLDGGGDFDRVSYAGSSAGVTVNLDTGLGSGGDAQGDTYIRLERVTGSQFDDTITGNEFSNSLKGNGGADTISGLGGRDFIEGRAGNDILYGGAQNDNILGGEGNDQLFGNRGIDKLFGGLGDDELTGGASADYFVFDSSLGAFGGDVIMDFRNNVDKLDVRNVFSTSNPANTADTFSDFTVSVSGAYGVKVKFEGGQVIYLDDAATGITVADIDASDFIFA